MDVVDLGRNVERMLLPVTAAIYQSGVEKPATCWTFEMAIGAISDQKLHGFLQRLPPFSLIRDFGKQNTRGNVSKISVSHTCYRHVGSKSTIHSPLA